VAGPDYQKKGRGHLTKTGPKSETFLVRPPPLCIFFQHRRQNFNPFYCHTQNLCNYSAPETEFQYILGAAGKFLTNFRFRPFGPHCSVNFEPFGPHLCLCSFSNQLSRGPGARAPCAPPIIRPCLGLQNISVMARRSRGCLRTDGRMGPSFMKVTCFVVLVLRHFLDNSHRFTHLKLIDNFGVV
jgi:hypothetical protein